MQCLSASLLILQTNSGPISKKVLVLSMVIVMILKGKFYTYPFLLQELVLLLCIEDQKAIAKLGLR